MSARHAADQKIDMRPTGGIGIDAGRHRLTSFAF
jgi:hypothetical protein